MPPTIKSLLNGSFPTHYLRFGSSSRKEDNPIMSPLDRPILVFKTSVRKLD
jgi:hypothetical protein